MKTFLPSNIIYNKNYINISEYMYGKYLVAKYRFLVVMMTISNVEFNGITVTVTKKMIIFLCYFGIKRD